jgi:hypothetical protein
MVVQRSSDFIAKVRQSNSFAIHHSKNNDNIFTMRILGPYRR